MTDLTLERRDQQDTGVINPSISMTPSIGEDYWAYRVRLTHQQAILGFPKFGTIGIGFAVEDDWNTNLPYTCDTDQIFEHIKHNKGIGLIADDDVRAAIALVQEAAREDRDGVR
jgi:hypothetical protein